MSQETIPSLFDHRVRKDPGRVALRHKALGVWRDVTWAGYAEHVRHFSAGLMARGFARGEVLAIASENRPEWVYADLGAMCAGGVAAGVYATNSAEQCGYIIRHAGVRFYVAENLEQYDKALACREGAPSLEKIIVIDTEGMTRCTDPAYLSLHALLEEGREFCARQPGVVEDRRASVMPDDLALLIYT